MCQSPAVIALGLIVGASIWAAIRYRSPLWQLLFAFEGIVLLACIAQCFVWESWKQFWQKEIPATLTAFLLAIASSLLKVKREEFASSKKWSAPQMLLCYGVTLLVILLVISHQASI